MNEKLFLACRIYQDGDGNEYAEALKLFTTEERAYKFCIDNFRDEYRKRLFNSDGTKKLIKVDGRVDNGAEYFRLIQQPQIYYDMYYLCLNSPDEFIEKYIKTNIEYTIMQMTPDEENKNG